MQARRTAALLALLALSAIAGAQGAVPSAHFGRDVYPKHEPELRFALSTDRFTQFDGDGNRFSPKYGYTTGFNFATLSYTDHFLDLSDVTYTVTASPGWSDDEPSRWLQNRYLHGLRNLPVVPVGETRDGAEYAMGGELNLWMTRGGVRPNRARRPAVLGVGMAASTVFSETYVHAGTSWSFDVATHSVVLRGLARYSWPQEGDAFRDLANTSTLLQGTIELVPREIHAPYWLWWTLGNPRVGMTLSQDSGVFEDGGNEPIEIQFMSFHVEWATGLRIETYNDLPNDTDMGPSFGLAVSFDVTSLIEDVGSRL